MAFSEVQIGPCRLIHGDCRTVLPTLSGVDVIITSPPYNLGTTTGRGFPKIGHYSDDAEYSQRGGSGKWRAASAHDGIGNGYQDHEDAMPHDEYVAWQHSILLDCWKCLSETGSIFYNHKPRILGGRCVTPLEYNPGLPIRQIIIWARAGGMNFSPSFYVPTHEWIVIIAKDGWRLKSKAASGVGDVWRITQVNGGWHPCQFPKEIPDIILETTCASLVMDPFSGSGTVAKSCIDAGVDFIGIEKSETFFNLACADIQRAWDLKCSELPFEKPEKLFQRSLIEDA